MTIQTNAPSAVETKVAKDAANAAIDKVVKADINLGSKSVLALFAVTDYDLVVGITPCKVVDYSAKGLNDWTENRLAVSLGLDWSNLEDTHKRILKNVAIIHHFNRKTGFTLFSKDKPNGMGKANVYRAALPEKFQNKDENSEQAESFTKLLAIASFSLWGKAKDKKSPFETTLNSLIKLCGEVDADKPESLPVSTRVLVREAFAAISDVDDIINEWTQEAMAARAEQAEAKRLADEQDKKTGTNG
jgi:hypothetical protein